MTSLIYSMLYIAIFSLVFVSISIGFVFRDELLALYEELKTTKPIPLSNRVSDRSLFSIPSLNMQEGGFSNVVHIPLLDISSSYSQLLEVSVTRAPQSEGNDLKKISKVVVTSLETSIAAFSNFPVKSVPSLKYTY